MCIILYIKDKFSFYDKYNLKDFFLNNINRLILIEILIKVYAILNCSQTLFEKLSLELSSFLL